VYIAGDIGDIYSEQLYSVVSIDVSRDYISATVDFDKD
jgi:hypothetical protein